MSAILHPPPLRPGGFVFTMASAIVSISLHNTGATVLSDILFAIALASFVCLVIDYLARLFLRRVPEGGSPPAGFLSLTFTGAAGVLASRFATLDVRWAALTLTALAAASWLALTYWAIICRLLRPALHQGLARVDGTWFLWVVGTQVVSVAAGSYASAYPSAELANFAAVVWSIGVLQFILIASVTFARLLLTPMPPTAEAEPYWVFMGSAAIIALAGSGLMGLHEQQSLLDPSAISTVSVILWSFSTWLIPLIVALALWQRVRPGGLSGYRPPMWSMVFPIGMYGEASRQLGAATGIGWMESIGLHEAWIAFAVWLFVFVTMLAHAMPRAISRLRRDLT